MKETALEINGLSKKIGDRIILSDINLSVWNCWQKCIGEKHAI